MVLNSIRHPHTQIHKHTNTQTHVPTVCSDSRFVREMKIKAEAKHEHSERESAEYSVEITVLTIIGNHLYKVMLCLRHLKDETNL